MPSQRRLPPADRTEVWVAHQQAVTNQIDLSLTRTEVDISDWPKIIVGGYSAHFLAVTCTATKKDVFIYSMSIQWVFPQRHTRRVSMAL